VGRSTSVPPEAGAVQVLPCPFTVRAWWGDELVAESSAAVRVERAGRAPSLFLPVQDIRLEAFHQEEEVLDRATFPVEGGAAWSIGPNAHERAAGNASWQSHGVPGLEGRDVLRTFAETTTSEWASGLATFDDERVVVELVDPMGAPDPRGVTVKRFPTWGDASQLVDILDVRPDGNGSFVGIARDSHRRPVVEGSQMLGQAIVAAGRMCPGRRAVSTHMVFMRAADAALPLRFEVHERSAGRTFTALTIDAVQADRFCATATLLLDVTAPDLIRHSAPPPDVLGPYDCESYDMSVTGRDVRVVEGSYTDDPEAPVGPPVVDAWVRFRAVPDDPSLHAGLLAQFTGHMSIAAALRPHGGVGQQQAHRTISTAINAIGLSLHADVRADRWMLYHHESTFAGDGMTRAEGRVHDEAGHLVASFSVDAMVRGFAEITSPRDDRRSL
jgi:acyl-CoA thioesterase-2